MNMLIKSGRKPIKKAKRQAKGPMPPQEVLAHPKNTKGLPSQCANSRGEDGRIQLPEPL